jgi:hypothetical protein
VQAERRRERAERERSLEKLAVDVAALADRDGMIAVTEQAPVRHCMR